MKKSLRKLCALAALFAIGTLTGWGQTAFSGAITADYDEGYVTTPISFSLTEVATALGTDTLTLTDLLDTYQNGESCDLTITLIYNGGESTYDGQSDYCTNIPGGFWMTQDGNKTIWGSTDCVWYEDIYYDTDADELSFYCGQFPGQSSGKACSATLQIAYNGKYAIFTLAYNVKEEVIITPTEGLTFSGLTQVGSAEFTISVPQTSSSKATEYGFAVADLAEKLGVDADDLADEFEKYLFVRYYDENNSIMLDSIDGGFTYTSDGNGYYWLQLTDEETGKDIEDCYSKADETNAIFYTYGYTFSGDSLYFSLGQNHGNAEENATYKATVYVCNNEAQAYALNLTLNVTESEGMPFEQMEEAGHYDRTITVAPGYSTAITIDIPADVVAEVEELLNVENGDIAFYAYSEAGKVTDGTTANAGFWFGKDGYVANYADDDAAFYIEYVTYGDMSQFNVGQYVKTTIEDGDSVTASILVLGETKYYSFNITFKVKTSVGERENWYIADTQEYDAQLVYDQDYAQANEDGTTYQTKLDWESILSITGLDHVLATDIYTWKTYMETFVADSLTNSNSCTGDGTGNGFWMSNDGRERATWSDSCAYGIQISKAAGDTLAVNWYVYPSAKINHSTDTTYVCELFIANSETGAVVKLVFNISYVENASQRTVQVVQIGSESDMLVLSAENCDEEGFYYCDLDLSAAYEALGITADEYDTCSWRVKKNSGGSLIAVDGFAPEDVPCNADGIYVTDFNDTYFTMGYDQETNKFVVSLIAEELNADLLYKTKIALVYGTQCYVFNLTIASEEKATGIQGVENGSAVKAQAIYNLAGQRVGADYKGIVIKNGKKYLNK